MKISIQNNVFTCLFLLAAIAFGQQTKSRENGPKISIGAYVAEQADSLPMQSKDLLLNKLNQLITANGITNGAIGTRFILTPKINVLTKDIIGGAPTMIALTLEITFYVGDGIAGRKFSSKSITVQGVGTNLTKAYIDGIKKIMPNDPNLVKVLADGKAKIVEYYNTNCESIIKTAQAAAAAAKLEEAITQLTNIPEVCKVCYEKGMNAAEPFYKKYIDQQCGIKLTQAHSAWNANQNATGAKNAGEFLAKIDPTAACYSQANALNEEITKRMVELGDKEFSLKMKMRETEVELEKAKLEAYKEISVAYYKRPNAVIVYNVNGWW
jgi:hypothetical protein